ncbi:MAG: hypothetical protein U0359_34015 [Byssovorax sp.]
MLALSLALAAAACGPADPRLLYMPHPIPLPPHDKPQLTGRDRDRLLIDEVTELRRLMDNTRPRSEAHAAIAERYAIAMLELSDRRRHAALALDPAAAAAPLPVDMTPAKDAGRAEKPAPRPTVDLEETPEDAPEEPPEDLPRELPAMLEGFLVVLAPQRDQAALGQLRPEARTKLLQADQLAAEALETLVVLDRSGRARKVVQDRILFEIGTAAGDLGQISLAEATYARLLRTFPESPYAGPAWLSLGHRRAEENKPAEAAACWEHVLVSPESKAQPIAAHQIALRWASQKRDEDARAMLGRAAILAQKLFPAALPAICGDAARLYPTASIEGCAGR